MTIVQHTTRRGTVIHRLSFHDLGDAVETPGEWRAYCPIHGSDHQRSLAISRVHGWGYCHACHATVFVEECDPLLAERLRKEQGRSNRTVPSRPVPRAHLPCPESLSHPTKGRPHSSAAPQRWQHSEVAALVALVPSMREALTTARVARAYLDERGLSASLAEAHGVGYLSRATWEQAPAAQKSRLSRWIGRIIFPLHSPDGSGFIGRTLLHWQPRMDENAHKALLDQPGSPRRWIKTNPAGWFGFESPDDLAEQIVLVEGGFDRLALLAAGLPGNAVIALVGTAARPAWLIRAAPQVRQVILALDADNGGLTAMERLANEFRRAGITVTPCPPPQDGWGKDWSERYRRLGSQCIWQLYDHFTGHIDHAHMMAQAL